jgi:hypothetical protein
LILLLLAVSAPGARANSGRWGWDASVGLSQNKTETERNGSRTAEVTGNRLSLDLGLKGNIVHPQFAPFTLDAGWVASAYEDGQSTESRNVGLGAELRLLPKGAYPAGFGYRRTSLDLSFPGDPTASSVVGTLDSTESWNGFVAFRRSVLRGARFSFEGRRFEFNGPSRSDRAQDRQVFSWSRLGRIQHSVEFIHEELSYGGNSTRSESSQLRVQERARFGAWNWNLRGDGVIRDTGSGAGSDRRSGSYGMGSSLTRIVRARDQLSLSATLRRSDGDARPATQAGYTSAGYRWRFENGWEVGPFFSYGRSSSANLTQQTPRGGIALAWAGRLRTVETRAEARGGYGYTKRDDGEISSTTENATYGLTGTFSHHITNGLSTSLLFDSGRNEFSVDNEEIVELPDFEIPEDVEVTGQQDSIRFNLGGQVVGRQLNSWLEWRRTEGTVAGQEGQRVGKAYRAGLQFRNDGLSADLRAASRTREVTGQDDAIFRSIVASVSWRYRRFLTIVASSTRTREEVKLLPDLDHQQFALGVDFRFGRLNLRSRFRQTIQETLDGGELTRRDYSIGVFTYLGGRVPIVTGTRRRGVIR